ncbi:hypothetical protein DFH08DRAFT_426930 [Mycena albidolilacea]|uniref:Uncharacterized protein n=1 Tax=Mycena albidolilacea TaxID=1033008 RepID=A0AAD7EDJ8_9AGAR|nr:hypothetical protein DFH08DRAFT_426930 [Mycena albidolilacea]
MQDLASPLIDSLLPSRPRDPRDTSQDRQDVEYISSCALARRLKMRIQWLLLAPPSQDIDAEFLKPLKNDGLDVFILIDCDTRWVAGWTLLSESSSYASPFFTFSQFQAIQRTTTRARRITLPTLYTLYPSGRLISLVSFSPDFYFQCSKAIQVSAGQIYSSLINCNAFPGRRVPASRCAFLSN